jgi:hypothetical protein
MFKILNLDHSSSVVSSAETATTWDMDNLQLPHISTRFSYLLMYSRHGYIGTSRLLKNERLYLK